MKKLLSLKIDENRQIIIYIPHFKKKINYFYKPKKELHKFDEIIVMYEDENQKIAIVNETIEMVVDTIKIYLEKILCNKLIIPNNIPKGKMGETYIKKYKDDVTLCTYEIISGVDVQVWIYNDEKGEAYIEIGTLYPPLYRRLKKNEFFPLFEDFMKDYKPYAFFHIDRKIILEWKRAADLLYLEIDDECKMH